MIVKVRGGYKIRSKKTGKLYPKIYKSKKAAQKQVQRHEMFKHMETKS